jgi:hypothetical protein
MAETPWITARREAWEEIGLPMEDSKLPHPFRVEHLCELPMNLAKTELGVRPCVAYLSAAPPSTPGEVSSREAGLSTEKELLAEDILIPRLDAKEVAAVFSAPFHSFLKLSLSDPSGPDSGNSANVVSGVKASSSPQQWYSGSWMTWLHSEWRMHNFYVPLSHRLVTRPSSTTQELIPPTFPYGSYVLAPKDPLEGLSSFRVFGMTARILVDAARVAYGQEPEFEHNSHFGDEELISKLLRAGKLKPIKKSDEELTRADVVAASKLS